ncbi:GNAT family N-acetyltransferase [Pedobacter sp. R-06]|uniref:GNAT family N-acetyltransferase n=1 Tax=Pedobacter sp. R-06 TaxID=3404051 RepID=UPI003CF9806F
MQIENSTAHDIPEIFRLYEIATDFQKTKYSVHWPKFELSLIETEIKENRQWKIIINGHIACIWATTFSDPQIWEEKNLDPAIYIHRIATNPDFRGQNLVGTIINWAKEYAKVNGKRFVRLDTVGENEGLIQHYQKFGFNFLGLYELSNTDQLPEHYHHKPVSLFEMKI